MENSYGFKEWSEGQRRIYHRAADLHAAHLEAVRQNRVFKGGMHWKRIKGRDYLYRYCDRRGHGGSLGPRSPETERQFAEFSRERRRSLEQLRSLRDLLAEQARFCRAALLHRVPRTAARILGQLAQQDFWRENLTVIGGNAIYAYEFAAGAFLTGQASGDLADPSRNLLTLATEADLPGDELLALLRQTDRTFKMVDGESVHAVNRRGFLVRLVRPPQYPRKVNGAGEPAAEAGDFRYLLSSPRFPAVVIDRNGFPVELAAPDPRAFALHKLWLAQRPERDSAKRRRDRTQALAVAGLVLRFLPQYYFFSADLRRFPEELVRQAAPSSDDSELAVEY
jgi:hypothetical protein